MNIDIIIIMISIFIDGFQRSWLHYRISSTPNLLKKIGVAEIENQLWYMYIAHCSFHSVHKRMP